MKALYAVLLALVLGVGCGSKEKATPDEAANELFVEAVELVSEAQSKGTTDIPAAIKCYEEALVKIRAITNKHKKSELAVKLVSGETLFRGKSMAQIEWRIKELRQWLEIKQKAAAEKRRRAEEMRRVGFGNEQIYKDILFRTKKVAGEVSKADFESVTDVFLRYEQL